MGEENLRQNELEVEQVEKADESTERGSSFEKSSVEKSSFELTTEDQSETMDSQSVESTESTEELAEEKSPEVLALEEEKKALIDRLSRLQAEFDNYRRRQAQERTDFISRANERLLLDFLPIMDNFERALAAGDTNEESFLKGVSMIYRQMQTLLEKSGVTSFEAEGESFDPHRHHAVSKELAPDGVLEDTVIQVLQKGYLCQKRVLRPAMVKVAE